MNLRFEYLYRDAGNFKRFGSAILASRDNVSIDSAKERLGRVLIDGAFFAAEKVGLPSLRFDDFLPHLDHGWHEFFALTEEEEGELQELAFSDFKSFVSALERTCR